MSQPTLKAMPQFILTAQIQVKAQSEIVRGTQEESEEVREEMVALHMGLQRFLEGVGYDLTDPVVNNFENPSLSCGRRIITSKDGPRGAYGEAPSKVEVGGYPADVHLTDADIDLVLRLCLQPDPLSAQQEKAVRSLRSMFDRARLKEEMDRRDESEGA